MTASPYQPYASAPSSVPADSTGVYPNLAGYAPIETGRRVALALVDSLIYGVWTGACMMAYFGAGRNSAAANIAYLVMTAGLIVGPLWAILAKSARLSGVLMGAVYVDVQTGRPSGGKVLGKFLLEYLISSISFGIAPLIIWFGTIQQPLQRNWFDRTLGLMLVDTRRGRNPDQPPPVAEATPAGQPSAIAAVQFPGADAVQYPQADAVQYPQSAAAQYQPAPVALWTPSPPVQPAPLPQVAGQDAGPALDVGPSPYEFGAGTSFGAPEEARAPINLVKDPDGIITATPRSGEVSPAEAAPAASYQPQPVVVRDMRSVDAAIADRTVLSPDSHIAAEEQRQPGAFLDDGRPLSLVPPTVLGRNPQAPGSHPDAVPALVDDLLASKTHLVLGRDDEGAWVIDLHSTNGVYVSKVPGVQAARIEAGRKIHLPVGSTVTFGRRTLEIR